MSFFSFLNRAIRGDKIRAEYFNARFDELVASFNQVQSALNAKVNKAGDVMTGHLTLPAGSPPSQQSAMSQQQVGNVLVTRAPIDSPNFSGQPTAPTPDLSDNSGRLATTAWMIGKLGQLNFGVSSFNGRTGQITMSAGDVSGALGYTPYSAANPAGYITSTALAAFGSNGHGNRVLSTAAPSGTPADGDIWIRYQ